VRSKAEIDQASDPARRRLSGRGCRIRRVVVDRRVRAARKAWSSARTADSMRSASTAPTSGVVLVTREMLSAI
jgi:hypothetical protein